jgi:hypothetical protein
MPILRPNAPPTSGAMTLIDVSGIRSARASCARTRCGVWVEDQISSVSVSGRNRARTARVSMGAGLTRLMRNRPRIATSAAASWASASPPWTVDSTRRLPGMVSCRRGAPGASAASGSTTWGSGSHSMSRRSSASSAA